MDKETLDLAHHIVEVLDERKGENILLMDISEVCSFTDYFVITTGASERTLKALSEEVKKRIRENLEVTPLSTEGQPESGWVLIDYGGVIIHLFSKKMRDYYQLEELWQHGQVLLHMH